MLAKSRINSLHAERNQAEAFSTRQNLGLLDYLLSKRMTTIDKLVIVRGITAFVIPVILSSLCYIVASIAARFGASTPRRIYVARLIFMLLLLVVWWGYFLPASAKAFSGNWADPHNGERYASFLAKQAGTAYGLQAIWAWCLVALLDRPSGVSRRSQRRLALSGPLSRFTLRVAGALILGVIERL